MLKLLFTLCLTVGLFNIAFSQDPNTIPGYNEKDVKVFPIRYCDGEPCNGYREDTILAQHVILKANYKNGLLHGPYELKLSSYNVIYTGQMHKGLRAGDWCWNIINENNYSLERYTKRHRLPYYEEAYYSNTQLSEQVVRHKRTGKVLHREEYSMEGRPERFVVTKEEMLDILSDMFVIPGH